MTSMPGRVGVLTFHRCFNYGSYWQARCLVEGLREMGYRAELLDHSCGWVERAEARCLLQPTLPIRTARSDFAAYKAKGRKFIKGIAALPRSKPFSLHAADTAERYDAVIVGSDEVWNFRHPWYGYKPLFFGSGIAAGRLVSYAASFGNHDAADGVPEGWGAKLGGFAALSVRDANSAALIEGATGVAPALVLDPCLQFPRTARRAATGGGEPYALVYGHGLPDWLAAAAVRWRRESGIRLVSIGYRNDWADEQLLDAGPEEFATAMGGAAAVITNFFHGCVFALINDRPLVTAPSAYRFNKVRDLVAALGAADRLVDAGTPASTIAALLETPPDAAVRVRTDDLRQRSDAFLRTALA